MPAVATTTFLLTDIEGSTRLWEEHPEDMGKALQAHDEIITDSVTRHGGRVFKHLGDGIAAAFQSAPSALAAASEIQMSLDKGTIPGIGSLKVRMGVHSGEANERDGDYFGQPLNRVARLTDAGHGGQVLVSLITARLCESEESHELVDLGEHRLRDLGREERIYQLRVGDRADGFPPLRTLRSRLNNLPIIQTSFIGREAELENLSKALQEARVVTVTGVGGAGKTRLALQAAADVGGAYPDGVWLVTLGAVSDPESVEGAVLEALGIDQPAGTEPRDVIIDYFRERSSLIVLDNCEHLVSAAADLVADITAAAPRCTIIATSRELLGVPGEVALGLRSMGLPRETTDVASLTDYEAIELFVDRAADVQPSFAISADNADAIVEICRRLDGMPLAIELAASRLRTFSPVKIAELLDQRFRLLTGGSRTALPRQQTLTATIEWSYRLLSSDEQRLFQRLSIFQGGFTLETVSAVATDAELGDLEVIELLPVLVDKSLVVTDEDAEDRFRLLETLRQFARDRLDESGEGDRLRRRHAEHFRDLVEEGERNIVGPDERSWRDRVLREFDNLRQAMTWALDAGEGATALALAFGFSRFSLAAERWSEALTWFERALDAAPEPATGEEKAERLVRLSQLLRRSPHQDRVVDLLEQAIALFSDLDGETADPAMLSWYSRAVYHLAIVHFYRGQGGEHNEHFTRDVEAALALARRADDQLWVAVCLGNLAHHADPRGDVDDSRRLFAEAEAAFRDIGTNRGLVGLSWQRANLEFHAGDLQASRDAWHTAIEAAESAGLEATVHDYRVGLALCELELGDETAGARIREGIRELFDFPEIRTGTKHALLQNLIVARAGADGADGRLERVATAAGVSESAEDRGNPVRWDLAPYFEQTVRDARQALGEKAFEAARARGIAMTPEDVVEFLTAG